MPAAAAWKCIQQRSGLAAAIAFGTSSVALTLFNKVITRYGVKPAPRTIVWITSSRCETPLVRAPASHVRTTRACRPS